MSNNLTIQECIDRGWVACPECGTHRGVHKNGDVLSCGRCSDVFAQQRDYWNLFVTLHEPRPTVDNPVGKQTT